MPSMLKQTHLTIHAFFSTDESIQGRNIPSLYPSCCVICWLIDFRLSSCSHGFKKLLKIFDARYQLPSHSYFSRTDQMILKVRHLNSRYVSTPRYLLKKYHSTILVNTVHPCCFVITTADLQLPSPSPFWGQGSPPRHQLEAAGGWGRHRSEQTQP